MLYDPCRESLPGQARRPAPVFRQWRGAPARGHGGPSSAWGRDLGGPRVRGSSPLVPSPPMPGSSPTAPEAVAAPALTQRRAPKSRSSWCQPPARCPAASRDDEAQKFTGPAPSRPAGLAARRRRRAQREGARKCSPAAQPSRLGPAPRHSQAPPLARGTTKPSLREGSVRRRRAGELGGRRAGAVLRMRGPWRRDVLRLAGS